MSNMPGRWQKARRRAITVEQILRLRYERKRRSCLYMLSITPMLIR